MHGRFRQPGRLCFAPLQEKNRMPRRIPRHLCKALEYHSPNQISREPRKCDDPMHEWIGFGFRSVECHHIDIDPGGYVRGRFVQVQASGLFSTAPRVLCGRSAKCRFGEPHPPTTRAAVPPAVTCKNSRRLGDFPSYIMNTPAYFPMELKLECKHFVE